MSLLKYNGVFTNINLPITFITNPPQPHIYMQPYLFTLTLLGGFAPLVSLVGNLLFQQS